MGAFAGAADKIGERVGCRQHGFQDAACGIDLAAAHKVERRLERMCETNQLLKSESSGAALDRMDGSEHGIDRVGLAGSIVEREQSTFKFNQLFFALLEERLLDGCHRIHGCPFPKIFRQRGGEWR